MATRFYFPLDEAAPVTPPAPEAGWTHVNSLARKAITTPDSSALSTIAYTPDAADHLVSGAAHHRQYVTDALEAQTIAVQTVTSQLQCLEASNGNNLALTFKLYVISNDGATAKETLFAIAIGGSEIFSSLRNKSRSMTLVAATIEAGDRLCIEIGLSGTPTNTGGVQGHNGQIRWGCDASSGDLLVNETETGLTWRGWLQFPNTLNFTGAIQTIVPAAISSSELFGAAVVVPGAVTVSPPAISSEEVVNPILIVQPIVPVAIASEEAIGTASIAIVLVLSPPSLPSEEAIGTLQLSLIMLPSSIPTAEAIGTLALGLSIAGQGIASDEAVTNPTVALGGSQSSADARRFMADLPPGPDGTIGRGDRAALSGVYPFVGQILDITGIPTAEVFGTTGLLSTYSVMPTSIVSEEAIGAATLSPGVVDIAIPAIPSEEAIGTLTTTSIVFPVAITSSEAIGTAIVAPLATQLAPTGIASDEAFGAANVIGVFNVFPVAIDTQETVGTPSVALATIVPSGIASEEAVGSPAIGFVVAPSAVTSQEAVGTATITLAIAPSAILSAEIFGVASVGLVIAPAAIVTAEILGTPDVTFQTSIAATGIQSDEVFGTPALLPQGVTIQCVGIASVEAVSSPAVIIGGVFPSGIETTEEFGDHAVTLSSEAITNEVRVEAFFRQAVEGDLYFSVTRTSEVLFHVEVEELVAF